MVKRRGARKLRMRTVIRAISTRVTCVFARRSSASPGRRTPGRSPVLSPGSRWDALCSRDCRRSSPSPGRGTAGASPGRPVPPRHEDAVGGRLHPYRLALVKQAWYLIARPEGSTHPVTYRVARFRSLKALDSAADVPEDFDLRAYFGDAWAVYRGDQVLRGRGAVRARGGRPGDRDDLAPYAAGPSSRRRLGHAGVPGRWAGGDRPLAAGLGRLGRGGPAAGTAGRSSSVTSGRPWCSTRRARRRQTERVGRGAGIPVGSGMVWALGRGPGRSPPTRRAWG